CSPLGPSAGGGALLPSHLRPKLLLGTEPREAPLPVEAELQGGHTEAELRYEMDSPGSGRGEGLLRSGFQTYLVPVLCPGTESAAAGCSASASRLRNRGCNSNPVAQCVSS